MGIINEYIYIPVADINKSSEWFRKIQSITLALLFVFALVPIVTETYADDNINVTINGQRVIFSGQAPVIVDGRTLVPIRGIFEQLGFDVGWNGEARQATLTNDNYTVVLTVGNSTFITNGVSHMLDVPAQIIDGSTMLPIRAVLESVDNYLVWDRDTRTVVITSEPIQKQDAVTITENVTEYLSPNNVTGKATDAFIASMADFSVELFKKATSEKENSLISPLSVMLALCMTANGADNETLAQMEALLGDGIPLDDLNDYIYSYVNGLPNEENVNLNIVNSIWLRDIDELQVKPYFLQKNADYYGASVYKCAFDDKTLDEINGWVESNTDGMIDKILDEIDSYAALYLINAVVFDAEWESVYDTGDIKEHVFTDINGNEQTTDFMQSIELKYLDDGKAVGFIKPYANNKYSFVALLPNEDVPIEEYIRTLTGIGLINTINNPKLTNVNASMPKFNYEYTIKMNEALIALGIPDAFDDRKADFSRIDDNAVNGGLYISEVLHKTFIAVDQLGTKAGAATKVEILFNSIPRHNETIVLDKPFVYVIIDNVTGLPVFIGTVMNV